MLSTNFDDLQLKNPLMPASGPLVGDYDKMKFLFNEGVGALVSKTISSKGAEVPHPCIIGGKDFIMNCELWSEYPPETWINNFLPKLKKDCNSPLIISVGYQVEDMELLIPKLDKYADAFEISTHYVGKDLEHIANIVRSIRRHTKKPIYMKLSPHTPDPVEFTRVVIDSGANGIVAINSLGPTIAININERKLHCGNNDGFVWTSGPVIKNMSLALIYEIRKHFKDITIIGTGGVKSADDVIEYLLVGANAVQMLSSAMLYGKGLYKKIINDLPKTLKKYGFNSINEVIEANLSHKTKYESDGMNYPRVIENKCTKCRLCERNCPYFAIEMKPYPNFNTENCFSCGLCESRCPTNAIVGVL